VRVTIEFFGVARLRSGVRELQLEFDAEHIPLKQLLHAAAQQLPEWSATCMQGEGLSPGYLANIDGARFVTDPQCRIHDGQAVLILAADAGG